jgi:putative addiction module component (TIGR02574 family)
MSADVLIEEASKLSPQDRVKIAEALWQSAWDEQAALPLSDAQRDELDRRLAEYEKNPEAGSSWEEVRVRLEAKL